MVDSRRAPGAGTCAQADSIPNMTTQERSVLAWERIADELTLLNQSFEQFLDWGGAAVAPLNNGPENEGTSSDAALEQPIEQRASMPPTLESYSVGGHRYANLHHAIEKARHARDAAAHAEGEA